MTTQQDWLSNYFGEEVAEDLEKTAQAHLLVKLAEQAGIDINSLSEEELMALVAELQGELEQGGGQPGQPGAQQPGMAPGGMPGAPAPQHAPGGMPGGMPGAPGPQMGPGGPMGGAPNPLMQQRPPLGAPQAPQGQPSAAAPAGLSPEMAKEAQAKFEEADALGRVMAHAYVEELDKIAAVRGTDKTAGARGAAFATKARDVASRASNFASKNKKGIGAAAGAGAAGFAAGRMSKKASAFEKLATDRAVEILQTLGIDPETGQPVQADQQQVPGQQFQQPQGQAPQGQDPNFDTAIDQRALQMLSDVGYDPNAVAQAYDQTVSGQVPQQ